MIFDVVWANFLIYYKDFVLFGDNTLYNEGILAYLGYAEILIYVIYKN